MRVLGILFAGLLTVAVAICVGSTPHAAFSDDTTMVQYVQSVKVQWPGESVLSAYTQTITLSAHRERIDDQPATGIGTEVIECDRRRSIYWYAGDKTYQVVPFEQMTRLYAWIKKTMKAHGQAATHDVLHEAPDSKTTIIHGFTAHHLIETQTIGAAVSDLWYAPGADPFRCPAFDAIAPPGPKMATSISSSGRLVTLAAYSMGTFGGRAPAGSLVLRQLIDRDGYNTVTANVTSIREFPYDPRYFEPPAGFVFIQESPRPLPSIQPQ